MFKETYRGGGRMPRRHSMKFSAPHGPKKTQEQTVSKYGSFDIPDDVFHFILILTPQK